MKIHCKHLLLIILSLIVISYSYLYLRWSHLWETADVQSFYKIKSNNRDTLRVAMIGDSWAEKLHVGIGDTVFENRIESLTRTKTFFESCGKGGEKSRGIYRLMFQSDIPGTKTLLSSGPDYCIVIAGINDAAANLGTKQYVYHYRLILDFLLNNSIRPVVVEIPNVDIWHLYYNKPIKDLTSDFLRSTMTRCPMYDYSVYRQALRRMLTEEHLMDSILYVPMECWNANSPDIDKEIFDDDLIHLNHLGYERLCSCIAEQIYSDLKKRTELNPSNNPMGKDSCQHTEND